MTYDRQAFEKFAVALYDVTNENIARALNSHIAGLNCTAAEAEKLLAYLDEMRKPWHERWSWSHFFPALFGSLIFAAIFGATLFVRQLIPR